jgi:hypothetical protein
LGIPAFVLLKLLKYKVDKKLHQKVIGPLCLSLVAGFLVVSSWSRKHNKFERAIKTTKKYKAIKESKALHLFNFMASLYYRKSYPLKKRLAAMPICALYCDILYTI